MNTSLIDFYSPARPGRAWAQLLDSAWTPELQIDVKDDDKEYVITANVPGIARDDLSVELDDNVLTIAVSAAKQRDEQRDEQRGEQRFILRERYAGSYARALRFCEPVGKADIGAKLDQGVLTVTVAKPDPQAAKREKAIAIK